MREEIELPKCLINPKHFPDRLFKESRKKIADNRKIVDFKTYQPPKEVLEEYKDLVEELHKWARQSRGEEYMMKTNCTWQEVYAIYNTLLPHEKLFLGNRFIDSPNTVFSWIVTRNGENAGFIELYDMKKSGSHKGELTVSVAIWEKYRGIGVLEELNAEAEKYISNSLRYDKLIWYAKDANIKSIRCAERLGYEKIGHELDHWIYIKKFPKDLHNIDRAITRFNNQLNNYDYGIIVDGKMYTDNIDFDKYTTIHPDIFELYQCGTCWDYTEYEAKIFKNQFGFNFTLNPLKHDREFSLYYMQIDDDKTCPTHTWLAYRNHGKIHLFESSWKSQIGITKYNTEEEMVKDYIKKHRKVCNDKNNPIIVTKYERNKKFGLTPEEFMRRCIYHGKVIYSEINSIPVQESNNMPMVFSEDDVYCNMSKFRNPYNIIFVCGTSGSGKSTLSKYLSDVHNATLVSLDHIMFWMNRKPRTDMEVKLFDPTIYKYYKEKGIPFDELVEIKNKKFFDYAKNRILDYIEWLSNQNEQFIVEGIQTSWVYNKNKFIVYPFIFKGTSMIKSWVRRAMREKDFFYKFDLKTALNASAEWKRIINRIRNAVMLRTTDIYTRKEIYVNNETAKNSM